MGLFAVAARLESFEFVEGLEELAVEVGFVAHDAVEVEVVEDEARLLLAEGLVVVDGRQVLLGVGGGIGVDVVVFALDDGGQACGLGDLIAGDAPQPPEQGGDARGQLLLKRALRGEVFGDACEVALVLRLVLHAGDDGAIGPHAVADGFGVVFLGWVGHGWARMVLQNWCVFATLCPFRSWGRLRYVGFLPHPVSAVRCHPSPVTGEGYG